MTRETKVGMVVAGSFVVLVGIVVASKMRGGADPADDVAQRVTPSGSEDSEPPDRKPSAKIDLKTDLPPKKLGDVRPVTALEPPLKTPSPPPVPAPEKGPTLPPVPKEEQDDILKKLALAKDPLPPPSFPIDPTPPPSLPGKDVLPPPVPPPTDPMKKVDAGPPDLPLPTPPPLKKDGKGDPPVVAPAPPAPPPVAPVPDKKGPSLGSEPPKMVDPPPATFPPTGPPPPAIFPTAKKEEPKEGPLPLPPPPPVAKKDGPPVGIAPPIPERKDDLPPLGAEFKKPPVGIAPPSTSLPVVRSVEIPPYALKADDLDMAVVSRKVYGSDRYGQALLAFNRDHPLAGDEIRATPPRLTPGKLVYIPPKEMLETKYGRLIADSRPVIGATPEAPPVPPVKIGAAPPLGLSPPPVSVPPLGAESTPKTPALPVGLGSPKGGTLGAAPPTKDATKRFIVSAPGQHILQIAHETLGDRNRWSEIYRLNPTIQPSQLIPAGTELRLPMEARVP